MAMIARRVLGGVVMACALWSGSGSASADVAPIPPEEPEEATPAEPDGTTLAQVEGLGPSVESLAALIDGVNAFKDLELPAQLDADELRAALDQTNTRAGELSEVAAEHARQFPEPFHQQAAAFLQGEVAFVVHVAAVEHHPDPPSQANRDEGARDRYVADMNRSCRDFADHFEALARARFAEAVANAEQTGVDTNWAMLARQRLESFEVIRELLLEE